MQGDFYAPTFVTDKRDKTKFNLLKFTIMKKMMIIAAMVSAMLIPAQMEANNRVNNKAKVEFNNRKDFNNKKFNDKRFNDNRKFDKQKAYYKMNDFNKKNNTVTLTKVNE